MQPSALFQQIHVAHGRPRLVAEHVALLERAARRLFGLQARLSAADLEREIVAFVARKRLPDAVSSFVRLELTEEGQARLSEGGISHYAGYAVRSIRPQTFSLVYELPLEEWTSVAAEAVHGLMRSYAHSRGMDGVVQVDRMDRCLALDGAQLFAFREGVLLCAVEPQTVEAKLLALAADRLHIALEVGALSRAELARCDELFAVDVQGITSVARCDRYSFMSLRVERLAEEMERLVNAR